MLASTFVLNFWRFVSHVCMGMAVFGLMAFVASAASLLSMVYLFPVGSNAKSMFLSCFISGIKSVSPAW